MGVKIQKSPSGKVWLDLRHDIIHDEGLVFSSLETLDDELRDILAARYRVFKVKFDVKGADTDNEGEDEDDESGTRH